MANKKDDKEKNGGFIDVFNIMKQLLFVLSVVSASLLTLCSLSVFVNPVRMPWLGVFQLLFPVFLISTVVLILLCLIFVRSRVWLPALILLLNFFSIRNYIPFNIPAETPMGSIKVMTYNTMGFALGKTEKDGRDMMAKYIGDQDADIICLQETAIYPPYFTNKIEKEIRRGRTMFTDSISNQTEDISPITCFSKYPIVGKKLLARQRGNVCAVFELLLAPNDTLKVVNCHLSSMDFSNEERADVSELIHNEDSMKVGLVKRNLVTLSTKISIASVKRAEMVEKVCKYLSENRGKNIILMGDFNDTPISYAHQRFSYYLTDCFVASGQGFGRSFNKNSMVVRIDNIFCSAQWKPYNCYVDNSILWSDHYPMICYLKRD